MKFLIGNGIDAATAYKGHFDAKIQGLTELQGQLDVASRRLAILETADPELFANDLNTAREVVKSIEQAIANIVGEDGASLDQAPGAENGLVGKLASLLSRHQKIMAKEEAEHAHTTAELEAQITEIRAQQAAAAKLHQAQLSANEALRAGIQAKLDSLGSQHPKVVTILQDATQQALTEALNKRITTQWLQHIGLSGLVEQAVKAIVAATLDAAKEAEQQAATIKTTLAPILRTAPKAAAAPPTNRWGSSYQEGGSSASTGQQSAQQQQQQQQQQHPATTTKC